MKTPRRSFVVEYKTSRRQTKAQPNSIWGNLDLGAVARAVESDDNSPYSTDSQVRSRPTAEVTSEQPRILASVSNRIDQATKPSAQSVTAITAQEHSETTQAAVEIAEPPPQIVESSQNEKELNAKQQAREKPQRPKTRKAAIIAVAPADCLDPAGLEDDLAVLSKENRRLKALLIAKIRNENAWLRDRLARFGSIA